MWEDFNFLWQELECLTPKLMFFIMYKSGFAMALLVSQYMFAYSVCTASYLFGLFVYFGQLFGCCLTLLQVYSISTATTASVLETEKDEILFILKEHTKQSGDSHYKTTKDRNLKA